MRMTFTLKKYATFLISLVSGNHQTGIFCSAIDNYPKLTSPRVSWSNKQCVVHQFPCDDGLLSIWRLG